MKEYELWLDESGSFEQYEQVDEECKPSLVGGILIPKNALTDDKIHAIADPGEGEKAHGMEMSYDAARRVIPAALEEICTAGGRLVYFENQERVDYLSDRDLYFKVLSSGLAQLIRMLSAQGPFHLDIIVAIRTEKTEQGRAPIEPEAYQEELQAFINEEFDNVSFRLDAESRIQLVVLSAKFEARLMLADYACNACLSLDTKKFQPVRGRLYPLISDGIHFPVFARTSESIIQSHLADGNVSGALTEFFTTHSRIDREKVYPEIMRRLASMSYRLQRLQVRRFAADLRSYSLKETDFERSESILKAVIDRFFHRLAEWNIPVQNDESLFWLLLSLADMYLREGDVIHAKPVMEELDSLTHQMNYRVENLGHLYFYRDKKALYEINVMEYEKAVRTMDATIRTMEALISVLGADDLMLEYFGNEECMKSEYVGDAYCMKIYAELFEQREDSGLFERCLRDDTEKALSQYQYPGELERNQQYRSKAENEAGNCREALKWLLKTKEIDLAEDADLVNACVTYLEGSGMEDRLSRIYYAMYYTEIMENASRLGDTELSNAMLQALEEEKHTINDLILPQDPTGIRSEKLQKPKVFHDIFASETNRRYHPLEIVQWKYGTARYRAGNTKAAEKAWDRALKICAENPDYTILKLVAVAIQLERLSFSLEAGDKKGRKILADIKNRCQNFLDIADIPENMRKYAQTVLAECSDSLTADKARTLSRKIAF